VQSGVHLMACAAGVLRPVLDIAATIKDADSGYTAGMACLKGVAR
jgi:hypothetical protein